jgi:signal transduction histidine kinase
MITPLEPEASAAAAGRHFSAVLRETRQHTLAGIRVVDRQGIVVASSAGDFGGQLQQEEVARALQGETVSTLRERRSSESAQSSGSFSRTTGIRVFVALPVIDQDRILGVVLLARTPASLWDTIQGKRRPLAYGAAAMVIVVLMLSWLTTRTIARPIAELRTQAQRAARGEAGAVRPLRHAGTREVAELSETLTAMSSALESRADYIRRFAAQVSHEFKTPLTSIRGAVELLRDHAYELEPSERARFQNIISADSDRLDRLVRRLLELARADVAGPGDEYCDAIHVVRTCVSRAQDLGLPVEATIPAAAVAVRMPSDELETVLGNLLDNARQHAPGSPVRVVANTDPGWLRIRIEDRGPGISSANATRIFEPFFTTARGSGSTGLGLPIVQALLAAHGGSIRSTGHGPGAVFELTLPIHSANSGS